MSINHNIKAKNENKFGVEKWRDKQKLSIAKNFIQNSFK